jgi:ABC-type lipoprotein release transport system permease subunit
MVASLTSLRIAWRNLGRNRRRTALGLAAIALSVVLVLVYNGIMRGYGDWMLDTITGPMLGHVQVHAAGWRRTQALDKTITDVSARLTALRGAREVASAHARVYAPALAARAEEGFAVLVLGVETEEEMRPRRLLSGAPPLPARQILVGALLARQMDVVQGDTVAIVGQGADGSLANDLFVVAALIETPVDLINRQAIVMAIGDARALFALGDEAHEIVVHGRDQTGAVALSAEISAMRAFAGLEVLDWQRLAPAMVSLLALVDVAWIFVLVLVLTAAASGVANTMLMATFERTHEIGMLLALGAGPRRIVGIVLLESLALGLLGALAGAAIGTSLVAVVNDTGVDYGALTGGPNQISFYGMNWSLRLYPRLEWIDVTRAVIAVMVTSLVAALWPAARAARLQPPRALRD